MNLRKNKARLKAYDKDICAIVMSIISSFIIIQLESCSLFCWIGFKKLALNLLLIGVEWLVIFLISGKQKISCIVIILLNYILGFINAQVIAFRGNEISFFDVKALRTALSVVSGYKIVLNSRLVVASVVCLISLLVLGKTNFQHNCHRVKCCLMTVFMIFISLIFLYFSTFFYSPFLWKDEGGLYNGIVFEWLIEAASTKISAPENYTDKNVENVMKKYTDGIARNGEETPHVIVIMSESYSDLDVLGNVQTNISYSQFFDKMCQNSVHGYVVSSVYGGTTANSEWEFLTASSMFFYPQGIIPYQQYLNSKADSLVRTLNTLGYRTVSVHPYKESGWDRDKVYPFLGFDESYWDKDFDTDLYVKEYISDKAFYDKIIDIFKDNKSTPLFIFGISMQNHGGYVKGGVEEKVYLSNTINEYHDINQYLSLLAISDEALEEFVSYFENCDENVVILFFGDHQPYLDERFYAEINSDMMSRYIVPFFIWKNYEDNTCRDLGTTSINYLSSLLLQYADIRMPEYNHALLNIREQLPIISASGYLEQDKSWKDTHILYENSVVNDLWILQYINNVDIKKYNKYISFFE